VRTYATHANAVKSIPADWKEFLSKRLGSGIAVMSLPNGRFIPLVFTGRADQDGTSAEQVHINLSHAGIHSVAGVMSMGMREVYQA
jgi:hypothetical protein